VRYLGSLALKQIIIQHAASPYSKINCSVGTNYSVREKSFIGIKIKICSVGSNFNLKNEKNIPLKQIVLLEQNGKKCFTETCRRRKKKKTAPVGRRTTRSEPALVRQISSHPRS